VFEIEFLKGYPKYRGVGRKDTSEDVLKTKRVCRRMFEVGWFGVECSLCLDELKSVKCS
jgi:hypothetical protein